MCWMCDHPGSTKEDYLAEVRATMLEHGWAVQFVEDDRVPFAYTVGLTGRGLPELLVTGLPPQRAARLLNRVAQTAVGGDPPTAGAQFTVRAGRRVEVVEVEHSDAHMDCAVAFYGSKLRALQLVLTCVVAGRGLGASTTVEADSRCWVCGRIAPLELWHFRGQLVEDGTRGLGLADTMSPIKCLDENRPTLDRSHSPPRMSLSKVLAAAPGHLRLAG